MVTKNLMQLGFPHVFSRWIFHQLIPSHGCGEAASATSVSSRGSPGHSAVAPFPSMALRFNGKNMKLIQPRSAGKIGTHGQNLRVPYESDFN